MASVRFVATCFQDDAGSFKTDFREGEAPAEPLFRNLVAQRELRPPRFGTAILWLSGSLALAVLELFPGSPGGCGHP